jgi:hypothetical protein
MRTRGIIIAIVVVLIVAAVFAWRIFNPGPMAFAGGSSVALSDYRGADPTGVPADLANADIVKRGEYLRAPRIAGPATPYRATGYMPVGFPCFCHLARSIPPISRLTRKPGSAITAIRISSMPCSAAFGRTARACTRQCRIRPTRG